ncbi:MAG: hypothetical protein Q9174_003424 [Haloplaca sp. 1 TL-2023]
MSSAIPRVTRASSRAASSRAGSDAGSDVPSVGQVDLRSSRAGSPAKSNKRFGVSTRDSKTYGSKVTSAAAAGRKGSAITGQVAGEIQDAISETREHTAGTNVHGRGNALESVEEEIGTPLTARTLQMNAVAEAVAEERARGDEELAKAKRQHEQALPIVRAQAEFEARTAGNQTPNETSILQKQMSLSDSNMSIEYDRILKFDYFILAKIFMILMTLCMMVLYIDVYFGPILGPRFDMLGFRSRVHLSHYQSNITSADLRQLSNRVYDLQTQMYEVQVHTQWLTHAIPNKKPWQTNYFSNYHKVVVNPRLTSPTWEGMRICDPANPPSFFDKLLWSTIGSPCPYGEFSTSPKTALGPWSEDTGPSWCAAAGEAKLQLATMLVAPMTPTELVIEHPPRKWEIVPKIIPAPKEVEMWMQVEDFAQRELIGDTFEATYGPTDPISQPTIQSMPSNYVPVGRWTFDYYAKHHVQSFRVTMNLHGAQTDKIIIRVNSNWADTPHSCLYRLRLHGVNHHPEGES